jgi:hypothetical protein
VTAYYEVSPHHTLRGMTEYLDRLSAPKAQPVVEEFTPPVRCNRPSVERRIRAYRYYKMPALTQSVPRPTLVTGKADPVWDAQFTTKFSSKPKEDAPLVTPKGAARVVTQFLDRAAEISYLASTQHLELATTRSELAANGISSTSLSSPDNEDMDAANIAQSHLRMVPVDPDPAYIATMSRRIEWERFIFACGPVERVRFTKTKEGTLGIVYDGPSRDPEHILSMKRHLKYSTIEKAGRLPTVEEIEDAEAFLDYYKKPFFAHATQAEIDADFSSRHGFVAEDPDPGREVFHADYIAPCNHPNCVDVGYSGPRGALGIDIDAIPDDAGDDGDDEFR